MFVGGCGVPSIRIDVERQAETGILPGERIGVLLLRYRIEGIQVEHLRPIQERFEQCIRAGMEMVKGDLTFLPTADIRKLVSADTTTALAAYVLDDIGTHSPESLLPLLAEPATASRLAEKKVRYMVLLLGFYYTSQSKWAFAAASGGVGAGKEWKQYSFIQATVLDLKHARVAGAANSASTGLEAGALGVFIIIPFPIYITSMTESRACTALGKGLAQFISGTSTP
jgi:hypothetical protein